MSKNCEIIHNLFNNIPRIRFPFDDNLIPQNGIYILFEKGELAHGRDRIVRIGTHTGKDQLRSRLKQHFKNKNKDRSIFRTNIGICFLNKEKDSYLSVWSNNLTTKKARERFKGLIDLKKQGEIEERVSKYIQENFSFVTFEVKDNEKRKELESKIISTVSSCEECFPSKDWLGLSSPKEKIRKSGLWLVNELWKEQLSDNDIEELKLLFIYTQIQYDSSEKSTKTK